MNKEHNIMHCWKCGKEMTSHKGTYEYDNKYLGHISVPYDVGELYACDCGEDPYVSEALSTRALEIEQQKIEQLLLLSVGGDVAEFKRNLIGTSELECVLGVTRQAIGKTPKYRNRIYHVVMNGDLLWWRPSAERFGKCGDGRFIFKPIKSAARRRLAAVAEMFREFLPPRSAAMFSF